MRVETLVPIIEATYLDSRREILLCWGRVGGGGSMLLRGYRAPYRYSPFRGP